MFNPATVPVPFAGAERAARRVRPARLCPGAVGGMSCAAVCDGREKLQSCSNQSTDAPIVSAVSAEHDPSNQCLALHREAPALPQTRQLRSRPATRLSRSSRVATPTAPPNFNANFRDSEDHLLRYPFVALCHPSVIHCLPSGTQTIFP